MRMIKSTELAARRIANHLHEKNFYNILSSWYYGNDGNKELMHGKNFNPKSYLYFYASNTEKTYGLGLYIAKTDDIVFLYKSKQAKRVADWVEQNISK